MMVLDLVSFLVQNRFRHCMNDLHFFSVAHMTIISHDYLWSVQPFSNFLFFLKCQQNTCFFNGKCSILGKLLFLR